MSLILEQDISEAENKWLSRLYNLIKFSFTQSWLPSHDETHCVRSWHIAKKLFYALDELNIPIPYSDIENALIAIFFHDLGMTKSLSPEHGLISRNYCEEYFHRNSKFKPKGLFEILNAIELHDDKSYNSRKKGNSPSSVISILSAADDLDALGFAGIFRYWEIYTLRKIPVNEIPDQVLANLETRYSYFTTHFSFLDSFLSEQQKRYKIIKYFYTDIEEHSENPAHEQTNQKILEYFYLLVRKANKNPDEIFSLVKKDCRDQKILDFFNNFNEEWSLGLELSGPSSN